MEEKKKKHFLSLCRFGVFICCFGFKTEPKTINCVLYIIQELQKKIHIMASQFYLLQSSFEALKTTRARTICFYLRNFWLSSSGVVTGNDAGSQLIHHPPRFIQTL